jgi:methyl-accepting chemotaxis protein
MNQKSLRLRLYLQIGLFILSFAMFGILAFNTLSVLRVNGPIYKDIVRGKDLIADILPPPAYILESYLVSLQLAGESSPEKIKEQKETLVRLKNEYLQRHDFWKTELPESATKRLFLQDSQKPALDFYEIIEEKLLPAVDRGDREKEYEIVYGSLREKYEEHRKVIDQVVKDTTRENQRIEAKAEESISTRTRIMLALALGVSLATIIYSALFTRSIYQALKNVSDVIGCASTQIADAATQVSASSQSLAEGANEQASSLEETSSALEEMASMISLNADHSGNAKDIATETRQSAENGVDEMVEMIDAMEAIKLSSNEISKIVKSIDEIAFQTNILALNAAVEAARAGEAGAGFAVVADEVRSLAQRAATAAKETSGKIDDAIQKSNAGVIITTKVKGSLHQIVDKARQVDQLIVEIATASKEQSSGIQQVNVAVSQMNKVTQANAAGAEETASASEELTAQAGELKNAVLQLQVLINGSSASSNRI